MHRWKMWSSHAGVFFGVGNSHPAPLHSARGNIHKHPPLTQKEKKKAECGPHTAAQLITALWLYLISVLTFFSLPIFHRTGLKMCATLLIGRQIYCISGARWCVRASVRRDMKWRQTCEGAMEGNERRLGASVLCEAQLTERGVTNRNSKWGLLCCLQIIIGSVYLEMKCFKRSWRSECWICCCFWVVKKNGIYRGLCAFSKALDFKKRERFPSDCCFSATKVVFSQTTQN